jgi:hypothetical protein
MPRTFVVVNLVCLEVKLRPVALGLRLEPADRAVWGSALWNARATILRFFESNLWATEMECLLEIVRATLRGRRECLLTHPDVPQSIQQSIFVHPNTTFFYSRFRIATELSIDYAVTPFFFLLSSRSNLATKNKPLFRLLLVFWILSGPCHSKQLVAFCRSHPSSTIDTQRPY